MAIRWFRKKTEEKPPAPPAKAPAGVREAEAPAAGPAPEKSPLDLDLSLFTEDLALISETEAAEFTETFEDVVAAAEGGPTISHEEVHAELEAAHAAVLGNQAAAEAAQAAFETAEEAPETVLARLREGLSKTQEALVGQLKSVFRLKDKIDEELLDDVEDILIRSDVGAKSAAEIRDRLRKLGREQEAYDPDALADLVRSTIEEILVRGQRPMRSAASGPTVYLVVGVNGTGKTTSIGKMALEFTRRGRSVMLIAADTFRAAAVEQLTIWGERTGACLVSGEKEGADPASVCFEGLTEAARSKPDVVLIDTAGRLHTKKYLMDELGKIVRVIKKAFPEAPHETILVLDSTTGQNALNQVNTFREVADLTGLVMTKLDGTARGGILVAIKQAHPDLAVFKIGIGEAPEDLRDFNAAQFSEALFSTGA